MHVSAWQYFWIFCLLRYDRTQVAAQHVQQATVSFNLGKCDVDVVCNVVSSARGYGVHADCYDHCHDGMSWPRKGGIFRFSLIHSYDISLPLPVGPHDGSMMAPMIVEFDRITGMSNIDMNSFT